MACRARYLGVADAGLVTYRDMVERARTIAEGTATPLIADADTGFGGLINVRQTVRGYEAAGVQAIQIEDQEMPKKCGHTPNRRVIAVGRHVPQDRGRGRCAQARRYADHRAHRRAHRARVSTRRSARGQDYAKAGADIVFVEAPESEDEFKRVGDEVDCWLLANMVPTGKSPVVSAEKLKAYGFNIAIYPSAGMSVVCAALEASYRYLQESRLDRRIARAGLHDGAAARADGLPRSLGVREALCRGVMDRRDCSLVVAPPYEIW